MFKFCKIKLFQLHSSLSTVFCNSQLLVVASLSCSEEVAYLILVLRVVDELSVDHHFRIRFLSSYLLFFMVFLLS